MKPMHSRLLMVTMRPKVKVKLTDSRMLKVTAKQKVIMTLTD